MQWHNKLILCLEAPASQVGHSTICLLAGKAVDLHWHGRPGSSSWSLASNWLRSLFQPFMELSKGWKSSVFPFLSIKSTFQRERICCIKFIRLFLRSDFYNCFPNTQQIIPCQWYREWVRDIPQLAAGAMTGTGGIQKPKTPSRSPMWTARFLVLGRSSNAFPGTST